MLHLNQLQGEEDLFGNTDPDLPLHNLIPSHRRYRLSVYMPIRTLRSSTASLLKGPKVTFKKSGVAAFFVFMALKCLPVKQQTTLEL